MSKYKTSLTQVLVKIVWVEHNQHSRLVLTIFYSGDIHYLCDNDHNNSYAAKWRWCRAVPKITETPGELSIFSSHTFSFFILLSFWTWSKKTNFPFTFFLFLSFWTWIKETFEQFLNEPFNVQGGIGCNSPPENGGVSHKVIFFHSL